MLLEQIGKIKFTFVDFVHQILLQMFQYTLLLHTNLFLLSLQTIKVKLCYFYAHMNHQKYITIF